MQPLQQLPASALRALRGVLTDIDDTLTHDGAIEPAALAALHGLQQARLPVIAITGRPAGWSEPFAMTWPVAAIVAENGAVMLRRDGDAPAPRLHAGRGHARGPTSSACSAARKRCWRPCPARAWRATAPAA